MKDNFFVKFKNCLHRLDKFPQYIDQGIGKAIFYGFLISLIFGGILGIYNSYMTNGLINKATTEINNPEYAFNIKDNTFTMAKNPIIINKNGNLIYINDKKTLDDANDIINEYPEDNSYMLVLKNGVKIQSLGMGGNYDYNQVNSKIFNAKEVNNETLVQTIQSAKKYYFGFITIYSIINRFINLIIDSLFVTVVGLIVSIFLGMMVKPTALYSLSIYAATVPFLLSLPIGILYPSISLQYPLIIATAIYVAIILKHIKNDLVNRQRNNKNNNRLNRFL